MASASNILHLPNEMVGMIVRFLRWENAWAFSLTSKTAYAFAPDIDHPSSAALIRLLLLIERDHPSLVTVPEVKKLWPWRALPTMDRISHDFEGPNLIMLDGLPA